MPGDTLISLLSDTDSMQAIANGADESRGERDILGIGVRSRGGTDE